MRAVIALFMIIAMGGLAVHGWAGIGGGLDVPSERLIRAEPSRIVAAMHDRLGRDGMEVVSRSDSGDYYRLEVSAAELRDHPKFSRLAAQGGLVLNARVTRRRIEYTARFDSGLVSGFTIDLSPAPDGDGTLARVAPVLRAGGSDRTGAFSETLQSSFARHGADVLKPIADAVEG